MSLFIVYTMRDLTVTKKKLEYLKQCLENNLGVFVYIDIIDNPSQINNFQEIVIKSLESCTLACVVETPNISTSPWVQKEIELITLSGKPKISLTPQDFELMISGDETAIRNMTSQYKKIALSMK